MAQVLVTGANGHVGCNTVRALIDAGHAVVAFVRPGADLRGLDGLDVAIAEGDVWDADAVVRAAEGCAFLINHAAVYQTRAEHPDEIMKPAVEGIENVLRAAKAAGARRVIHTSSTAAVGFGFTPDTMNDESDWNTTARMHYYLAKTESERVAHQRAAELDMPLISLNPCMILGRHDYRITPSTDYVRRLIDGTAPTMAGGLATVDVRDVAQAHVVALDHGEPGERYLLIGENLSYRELGKALHDMTGLPIKHVGLPGGLARALMPIIGGLPRLVGKPPLITGDEAYEVIGRYGYFNGAKAVAALGLTFRSARDALEDTVRWLVHRNELSLKSYDALRHRFPADPAWGA
jgi:dihydroflavonol-4-reductase